MIWEKVQINSDIWHYLAIVYLIDQFQFKKYCSATLKEGQSWSSLYQHYLNTITGLMYPYIVQGIIIELNHVPCPYPFCVKITALWDKYRKHTKLAYEVIKQVEPLQALMETEAYTVLTEELLTNSVRRKIPPHVSGENCTAGENEGIVF